MSARLDITGKRFGHLIALERIALKVGSMSFWKCACDCGLETVVIGRNLTTGNTTSCSCRSFGKSIPVHSMPEYKCWCHMIYRCENPKSKSFLNYGGRGIKVDPVWRKSFQSFLEHIGPRPSNKYSVERMENDGHYEPGNVRWATKAEQNRNKRGVKMSHAAAKEARSYAEQGVDLSDIAVFFGVHKNTARAAIKQSSWQAG